MIRLTLISLIILLTSCKSTKQTTTYEKISSGQDLDKVTLISFDSFFNQWVYNRRIQKLDLNIRELNKDNQFTYFGKPSIGLTRTKWTFYKVHTDTLSERFPNYEDFYGEDLKHFLWTEVVPKEDKELFNDYTTIKQGQAKAECPIRKNRNKFFYSLVDKKVILTMIWDIECNQLEKLKDKKYQAKYNLTLKQFEK